MGGHFFRNSFPYLNIESLMFTVWFKFPFYNFIFGLKTLSASKPLNHPHYASVTLFILVWDWQGNTEQPQCVIPVVTSSKEEERLIQSSSKVRPWLGFVYLYWIWNWWAKKKNFCFLIVFPKMRSRSLRSLSHILQCQWTAIKRQKKH